MMDNSVRDIASTRKQWLKLLEPGSLIAPGNTHTSGSLIASDIGRELGSPMAPGTVGADGSPMASSGIRGTVGSSMTLAGAGVGTGSPMASVSNAVLSAGAGLAMPPVPAVPGVGSPMASPPGGMKTVSMRVRLPGSMSGSGYTICDAGQLSHATRLGPLEEEAEREFIGVLVRDLNAVFALELDLDPDTWRGVDTDNSIVSDPPVPKRRFIVVGASHAAKLADELGEQGEKVICLATPAWRLTENAEATATELKKAVSSPWQGETIVVYQIYDSSIYFASSGPGEMSLPRKNRDDGRYHVEGALKMADRETFMQIVYSSVPLLRAGGEGVKIVVAPMPRYITGPCCNNRGHVTNFGDKKYGKIMGDKLADIGDWVKEFVYGKRITNFQVFSPTTLILGTDDSKDEMRATWGRDPVHMTKHGYGKEARALLETLEKNLSLERRSSTSSKTSGQGTRSDRPLKDWSSTRQEWVNRSDATATRDYGRLREGTDRKWREDNANVEHRNRGGASSSRGWRRGGSRWQRGRPY